MSSQKQQLRKKLSQLCCIKKCTGVRHRDILQHLNDDSLHLLSEAAHNILISRKENIPPRRIGTLRPLKKELVYLAAPKNSLVKKRKLVATTKGSGIISLILSTGIMNKLKQNIYKYINILFFSNSPPHQTYFWKVMDLHLVSSNSEKYFNNTRSHFENIIPDGRNLLFNTIALKEIFFTAEFVNIEKLDNTPHFAFAVPRDKKEGSSDDLSFEYFGQIINRESFGKIIYENSGVFVLELIYLIPQRIETLDDLIIFLNSVFKATIKKVEFFRENNKIHLRSETPCYLACHNSIMKFIGYEENSISQKVMTDEMKELTEIQMKKWMNINEYSTLYNSLVSSYPLPIILSEPNFDLFKPNKILILSDIVNTQIYQDKLLKYIGIITTSSLSSKKNTKNYHNHQSNLLHFQPINPISLSVCQDKVNSIKITLVDENLKQLKLSTSSPTLLTMDVKSSKKISNQMIYSSSSDKNSLKLHPSNNAGFFTHYLPSEINLTPDSSHSIELLSVNISSKIFNITPPFNKFCVAHSYNSFKTRTEIEIKPNFYSSLESICQSVLQDLWNNHIKIYVKDKKICFETNFIDKNVISKMTFPNVLAVILGIEENDIQSDITIIIPGIDSHQGLFHPKLSLLYPDFILIYLEDLVEFSTVGGVEISLLKIIPAPPFNSDHETYHFDFNSSNAVKLNKFSFKTITYNLRDITGRPIYFAEGAVTDCHVCIK